ncbi:MAG: tyrosine-type recombinase/integrase [Prolixibacteraceae bacterium]|nr:tyrosine-type recombinase/integrase [Prolixibacteraceae bacterium]
MKGSIQQHSKYKYYYVAWPDNGKIQTVSRYRGFLCRDGEIAGMTGRQMAERLLSLMRADVENGTFRIEKWKGEAPSDIIPYLWKWLEEDGGSLSPATHKDYENSIKNHLIPWFTKNPYQIHELQYDVLCRLLNDINRTGKGKKNVIYCLRRCLVHAFKSNRIPVMPLFPEEKKYNIVDPIIKWLPEERQIKVIKAIPEQHQPIFWWLKYHLRRPSEAMALHRIDYDKEQDAFIVRRTFSAKELVQHTKTHKIHVIPCHSEFKKIMQKMPIRIDSQFFFVNPHGKLAGKHYSLACMEDIWHQACAKAGEDIDMYSGLKHSSCSQYINEKHYSIDQVQMLTDHARRESVKKYAMVQLDEKRRLMEGWQTTPLEEVK